MKKTLLVLKVLEGLFPQVIASLILLVIFTIASIKAVIQTMPYIDWFILEVSNQVIKIFNF